MSEEKIDIHRMSTELDIGIRRLCKILGVPFQAETVEELRDIERYDPENIPVAEQRRRRKLRREHAALRLKQHLWTEDLLIALEEAPPRSPEKQQLQKRYFNRIKSSIRGITVTALVLNTYEKIPEKYHAIRRYVMRRLLSLYCSTPDSLSELLAGRGRFRSDTPEYKHLTKRLIKLSREALRTAKTMDDLQALHLCLSKSSTMACDKRICDIILNDLREAKTAEAVMRIYMTKLKHFPIKAHRKVRKKLYRLSEKAIRDSTTIEQIKNALANGIQDDHLQELAAKKAAPFFQITPG